MPSAFRFHVFPSSGVPIYRQLVDQIRAQAASGRIAVGELLPGVRQVAEELQVNPMTVSKAYSLLEREGVLELVRGQGMRVRGAAVQSRVKDRLEELRPLLEQVAARSFELSLSTEQVLAALRALLKEAAHERPRA
jgi:GntR family transcriptional regulator